MRPPHSGHTQFRIADKWSALIEGAVIVVVCIHSSHLQNLDIRSRGTEGDCILRGAAVDRDRSAYRAVVAAEQEVNCEFVECFRLSHTELLGLELL